MPYSSSIRVSFVDASAYFALLDEDDANHTAATSILNKLLADHTRLITTDFVLAETHALLLTRLNHTVATRFLRDMARSSATVVHPTPEHQDRARAIIYQYQDKDFSFTDAISFAVMEWLDIRYAFTFDRHFVQYGWMKL